MDGWKSEEYPGEANLGSSTIHSRDLHDLTHSNIITVQDRTTE